MSPRSSIRTHRWSIKMKKKKPLSQEEKKALKRKDELQTGLFIAALMLPVTIFWVTTELLVPGNKSIFTVVGMVGSLIIGIGLDVLIVIRNCKPTKWLIFLPFAAIGGISIFISCLYLYIPAVYQKLDKNVTTNYVLLWMLLALSGIMYIQFRYCIDGKLRNTGLSKTTIKKEMVGFRNKLWYESLNQNYRIGSAYYINLGFTILYSGTVLLHILLGWWKPGSMIVCILTGIILLMSSLMNILYNTSKNRRGEATFRGVIFYIVWTILPLSACYLLLKLFH